MNRRLDSVAQMLVSVNRRLISSNYALNLTYLATSVKSKCYQKSNIFKISWQQLKNQFAP